MQNYPLTSLSTLLALATFFWTLWLVGKARSTYGIHAPSVTGHEQFERVFRVQMNTLEQIVFLFPVLWLCAFWTGDAVAAAGGVVWSAGRFIYANAYIKDPKSRGIGFVTTFGASVVMMILVLYSIAKSLL